MHRMPALIWFALALLSGFSTPVLADESLLAKILTRIRLFDFGRREVGVTTISYPVHFLPT